MNPENKKILEEPQVVILIPAYNHEEMISDVITKAKETGFQIIVVDDGSTDKTSSIIDSFDGITILRHSENRGKGAALKTGFKYATSIADWAITFDADGQHNPEDVKSLLDALESFHENDSSIKPIVLGVRQDMHGEHIPWTSSFGRTFSNFWVWISGGPKILDSQSGFRLYPLPESAALPVKANRFQMEVEILVWARRYGIPVIETSVTVDYAPGSGRKSHFRPFFDFLRNSGTFTRLIIQRILIPNILLKKIYPMTYPNQSK